MAGLATAHRELPSTLFSQEVYDSEPHEINEATVLAKKWREQLKSQKL
jgi:hypothetical protein